ncbi:hypothetical protein A2U01_0082432, partial [Trifolium medium]|nr:hypothetical protein [Trifolium medium]
MESVIERYNKLMEDHQAVDPTLDVK